MTHKVSVTCIMFSIYNTFLLLFLSLSHFWHFSMFMRPQLFHVLQAPSLSYFQPGFFATLLTVNFFFVPLNFTYDVVALLDEPTEQIKHTHTHTLLLIKVIAWMFSNIFSLANFFFVFRQLVGGTNRR